jgi:hypothetical protein
MKAEESAQMQTVSQRNELTYDNQQKEMDQLKRHYEQEFGDRLQAITKAQEEARATTVGTTRAIIAAQAHQIREGQKQELTEQTKQLQEESSHQRILVLECRKEAQELKTNTARRIDVLGRPAVQEIKTLK